MKTRLSPKVEKAFLAWVACDAWYTGHPADDERFYRFVWTVARFSRRPPSETTIYHLIISTESELVARDFLQNQALHYSSLYATLLDFAKVRTKGQPFLPSEFE